VTSTSISDFLRRSGQTLKSRAHLIAPTLLLAGAFLLRFSGSPVVEALQMRVFDAFQAMGPRAYEDAGVRVVDIDEESLARCGPWPWPRGLMARLTDRLRAQGASVIAFDIVFPDPDRVSPVNALKALSATPEVRALLARAKKLEDPDIMFAQAARRAKVVTGFALTAEENQARPARRAGVSYAGDSPLMYLDGFSGAIVNLPAFEAAAAGNGGFSALPEVDGVTRRIPLLYRVGPEVYPSLVIEALRVHKGASSFSVRSSGARGARCFGQHTGISQVRIADLSLPTDSRGRLWLHFTDRAPGRTIAAWRVLEPAGRAPSLKGAVVFVGSSADRLKDIRATPLHPSVAGVEIHAEAAEQALLGRHLRRPDWADGVEAAYMLALGAALIFLLPRLGAAACGAAALAAAAAAFPASWYAFKVFGWLLDPLFPSLVAALVYLASSLIGHLRSEAERRRLEVLDAVKDEMIATVSHDLRGPVNAMIMVVDTMRMGLYGPMTEKQKHNLDLLKASGTKLTSFVSNILDAAKIKAGKMEFHMQDVRPREMLVALTDLYALSASTRGVALECAASADLPPVRADREKIEQVVNNLIGNALKFTAEGGRITVSAERDGRFVRVSVTDTGYGIAPEDIPKLFKKFEQVDLARQREVKLVGTGLGLSICKTVVEAHGGKIWAESEKGRGASFKFTVPVSGMDAASAEGV